jgi:hypothetical protein
MNVYYIHEFMNVPLFTRLSFQWKWCSGSAVVDLGSCIDTCLSPPPFPIAPSFPQLSITPRIHDGWVCWPRRPSC